jgi:surfactin synthase thioesterase subunit
MDGWLRCWSTAVAPRLRLICLPPAGGAAHLFQPWAAHLPMDVELLAVELPGHGTRLAEPPLSTMEDIVAGLAPRVRALPPLPAAVLGHSMGAMAALELCRRLRAADPGWRPLLLIVVGAEGRRSRRAVGALDGTPDERLADFLIEAHAARSGTAGAAGAAVLDPALRELVMPALRADVALLNAFQPAPAPPLGCPVRVLAGLGDPFVGEADRADWAAESDGDFAVHLFPGGHFFYEEPAGVRAAAGRVRTELNRLAVRSRG